MRKPNTIFVLTAGEYSDYRVLGVFSSKEKAEEVYAKREVTGRDYCHAVEEYFLDNDPNTPEGMKSCSVLMRRDGMVVDIKVDTNGGRLCLDAFFSKKLDRKFFMHARNEKHAVKIANERRTKMIAENRW